MVTILQEQEREFNSKLQLTFSVCDFIIPITFFASSLFILVDNGDTISQSQNAWYFVLLVMIEHVIHILSSLVCCPYVLINGTSEQAVECRISFSILVSATFKMVLLVFGGVIFESVNDIEEENLDGLVFFFNFYFWYSFAILVLLLCCCPFIIIKKCCQ
jgi:hypothetical protein